METPQAFAIPVWFVPARSRACLISRGVIRFAPWFLLVRFIGVIFRERHYVKKKNVISRNKNMNKLLPLKIKAVRKLSGMSQKEFARKLGLKSHGHISNIEHGTGKSNLTRLIDPICIKFHIDEAWLTDETDKRGYSEKEKKFIDVVRKKDNNSTGSILSLILSPETRELLEMTREVIESDTGFAESLKSNIRSFHYSLALEKRLEKAEHQGQEVHKGSASDRAANNE